MAPKLLQKASLSWKKIKFALRHLYAQKDLWWLFIWLSGLLTFGIWDALYLNAPAWQALLRAMVHTALIALLVSVLCLSLAWIVAWALTVTQTHHWRSVHWILEFILNLLRSVPQILGVLAVYYFIVRSNDLDTPAIILLMAGGISLFIFVEVVDLMRERIAWFRKLDFYAAMRVNGISQHRIINLDILWQNSRVHIINKLVSVFGMAIFLQCSVDFILSVGLSTEISAVNLPVTLGSLLAKTDSKQDILAIGYALTRPTYLPRLLFEHLQGISIAFYIVFSLFGIFKIANGFAERHRL